MKSKLQGWLKLFRVVNLPTVPGDVLVGAASAVAFGLCAPALPSGWLVGASVASVFIYLFGLVDNDLVGATTDQGRPIPEGLVSLTAARLARGLAIALVAAAGLLADLPPAWWFVASSLLASCVIYNRTKNFLLMGLCRGLNVAAGLAAVGALSLGWFAVAAPAVWTAYIAGVTKLSEGEEGDPLRKALVGQLIGALVYLQLLALLAFYLVRPVPATRDLLLVGAVLLVVLRLMRRLFPKVSAS